MIIYDDDDDDVIDIVPIHTKKLYFNIGVRDACALCVFCNIYIYIFVLYFVVVLDRRSRDDCAKTGFQINRPLRAVLARGHFDHLIICCEA